LEKNRPPSSNLEHLTTVKEINANWVAVIPYAFMRGYSTKVIYNTEFQWWGEKEEGISKIINEARKGHLKIMLKPHLWISGDGWAGDFTLKTETEWLLWEQSYTKYILDFCKLAKDHKVELFCIGTELRQVAKQRPQFWLHLIKQIRTIYNGQLTYAANWDNYQNINFWAALDYIGIDSYFPLSEDKTPNTNNLKKAWLPIKTELKHFSNYYDKPILFTEFGYTSSDYCAKESWSDNNSYSPNQQAQANAYHALFETYWDENWFAGGFLWKWHLQDNTMRNYKTNFTPQGKKASHIIMNWYSEKLR